MTINFDECKMLDITRYSINGLHFYLMQPEELRSAMQVIRRQIDAYTPSISGICPSDRERYNEWWAAWQNAEYNLRMKTNGESQS